MAAHLDDEDLEEERRVGRVIEGDAGAHLGQRGGGGGGGGGGGAPWCQVEVRMVRIKRITRMMRPTWPHTRLVRPVVRPLSTMLVPVA